MIRWAKLEQEAKIVDALNVDAPKDIQLFQACRDFQDAKGIQYPQLVKYWCQKILENLDGKRSLRSITVTEAVKLFDAFLKKENEATAYRVRASLVNVIRYAYTGELPEIKPKIPRNGHKDAIGRLKFSKAKVANIRNLIPLYNATGRFGRVKAEVQKQIYSLGPTEAGMIEAPKRSMDDKEARALVGAVTIMLAKGGLPWVIKHNPNDSVFIIIRKEHLEKLMPKMTNPKKGA